MNILELKKSVGIYTTEDLMAILGVGEKTLRKYRVRGWLSYSKCGDKFWYTQKDLNDFISNPKFFRMAYDLE